MQEIFKTIITSNSGSFHAKNIQNSIVLHGMQIILVINNRRNLVPIIAIIRIIRATSVRQVENEEPRVLHYISDFRKFKTF